MKKNSLVYVLLILLLSLVLNACGPTATEAPAAPIEEVAEVPADEAESETPAEEVEAPPEEDPAIGGTFIMAITGEPDTLDPHLTSRAVADLIMQYIGGSLVWMTPDLTYEPYLAESWTTSEDGLVWEFKVRQDVKYHDGTPLTAHDYAFTFNRALDPETASPAAGPILGNVDSVEAVDDYTLRLTLPQPNAPILYGLADPGYLQPINQAIFESIGTENYGRSPVGVGPFIFKEWSTGEKIVLERNPDYNWGPASAQGQGAYNIETLEFTIIPEYSTILAGLEADEIDAATVQAQDVDRLEETEMFQVFAGLQQGIDPYVVFNLTQAPFDDLRVRQAFNLAVNKEALIQVAVQNKGVVQHGYISSSMMGYWSDVEDIGYEYDLERAKALMEEAGYTLNTDGILEKDGNLLSLSFYSATTDQVVKATQVLVEQYAELGVELEIQQLESGVLYPHLMSGDYQIGMSGMIYGEADLMYFNFHSSQINSLNLSRLNDPEMDALLEQSRAESDPAARQEILNQLQQKIIKEAYVVPLYSPMTFTVVNNRWQGVVYNEPLITLDLSAAYLEE